MQGWPGLVGSKSQDYNSLYEVEHRNTVSHRAQDGIPIGSEYDISLPIDSTAKVGELDNRVHSRPRARVQAIIYLEVGFHHRCSIGKKNRYRSWAEVCL